MTQTIANIQTTLQSGKFAPTEAVEARLVIAGYYAFASEQLEDILIRKPATWAKIRETCTSDKQADREFEKTQDGINEIGLSLRLKRYEKMLSVLKTVVDTANTQWQHS